MNTFLALVCIILGIIVAAFSGVHILFGSLTWFVLALALEHLGALSLGTFVVSRREETK